MRIGISSPYLDSLAGGERYILTTAECLSREYEVEIFWNNLDLIEEVQNRLAINLSNVKLTHDIFYSSDSNLLTKLQVTRGYDLFIFLSDGSVPFSLARRNILHFQMPFTNVGGQSILNRLKLRRIDAVICNSRFTKQFIDREYGVNSIVIYPPVAIDELKPTKKANVILSVGRFHPIKRQVEMLKLFKELGKDLKAWKLILAGGLLGQDSDYYNRVLKMAGELRVELFPNIGFSKLKKLYGQAKIYWHAAGFGEDEEENPGRMEHFGITTVESMAAGCVPISFRGGGQKEIIEHTQNGFLWETLDDLKRYTQKMLQNDKLRKKIAQQAQKDSQKYSVGRFCKEIEHLVKSIN